MKKLSGVFICLLLFTFISSARSIEVADAGITDKLKAVIAAKNAPAGGGGCAVYASEVTSDDDNGLGYNTEQAIMAQSTYDPGANKTICQLDFYFAGVVGTVTSIEYKAQIYIMSGSNLTGGNPTGTCTSTNTVTGADISAGSPGWIAFTGFSCALNSGTDYGITVSRVDHENVSTSNYVRLGWRVSGGTLGGFAGKFQTDLSNYSEHATNEVNVKIYTQ